MNRRDFSEVRFVWVCATVCGVGSVSLCVELHSELQRLLRGEVCGSVTVCGVGSVSLCVELHSELQRCLRGEVYGSVTVCGVAQ